MQHSALLHKDANVSIGSNLSIKLRSQVFSSLLANTLEIVIPIEPLALCSSGALIVYLSAVPRLHLHGGEANLHSIRGLPSHYISIPQHTLTIPPLPALSVKNAPIHRGCTGGGIPALAPIPASEAQHITDQSHR